jgi:broad specificity phosphatase PhoE
MRKKSRIAVLVAALLLATSAATAQKAVFVVRHAEKISNEDERLSEAGKARAQLLAKLLGNAGIGFIYATDTERAKETARPLAEALGQTIRVYDKPEALIETLRKQHPGDVVLVVGHSNTVPRLLELLGSPQTIQIAPDEYDNLFIVVPKEKGTATVVRMKY